MQICSPLVPIISHFLSLLFFLALEDAQSLRTRSPKEAVMDKKWTWPEIHEMVQQNLGLAKATLNEKLAKVTVL